MKTKRILCFTLTIALAVGLFAAMPLTVNAEEGPFRVTLHPAGATYVLGDAAVPLMASFLYDALAGLGYIDSGTPIKAQWYWSNDNSNVSRGNGFVEHTVPYDRLIRYSTTLTPATDTIGVKYYYAVLTYGESITGDGTEPKEAVTDPARIEVIAPRNNLTEVTVKKVDDKGNPLPGATIQAVSSGGTIYEAVTDKDGVATFALPEGTYIISESKAPAGYTPSDDTYTVSVTPNGIFLDYTTHSEPYEPVTFVNVPEPPRRQTPTPTNTPSPAPVPVPTPTVTPVPKSGTHGFTVKKTDENGASLAGATIRVEGLTDSGIPRVYNVTTNNKGEAAFTVEYGTYELSEYAAPNGYNATDERYALVVNAIGVYIQKGSGGLVPYDAEQVVFVDKKIPKLNKDDHFAYMQGYPEGTFRQEANMSRAEAVVMFSRLLVENMDLKTNYYKSEYYPDVPVTEWYANQVCFMHMKAVLGDYSRDGRFRPDEPVTRAEFATLAAHFDNLTFTDSNKFTDVADNHWAVKYINSAAAKGWIVGYPDDTFKPEAYITRAEVVALVNRIIERKADTTYVTANVKTLPRSYSDLASSHWAYWDIMEASIGHDYIKDDSGENWTAVYK